MGIFLLGKSPNGLAQTNIITTLTGVATAPATEVMFIDLTRQSFQTWQCQGQAATVDPYTFLDANGYPTGFPTGGTSWNQKNIYGWVADPADGFGGRYVLDWNGTATITGFLGGSGITITPHTISANRIEYDITGAANTQFLVTLAMTSITTAPTSIRFYRKAYESRLNAGQQWDPDFISYYQNFGRVRFMDLQGTNGSYLTSWAQRTTPTQFSQLGYNIYKAAYCGISTQSKGDYTTASALTGNPTSWTDGMMVQTLVPPGGVSFIPYQSITLGATTIFQATGHPFATNDWVQFFNGAGGGSGQFATASQLNSKAFQITKIDADHFSLNGVNSSTWNGTSGGGDHDLVSYAVRLFCGSLPVKSASLGDGSGTFGLPADCNTVWTYSAAFDRLIYNGAPDGNGFYRNAGMGIETLVDLANTLGPGVQPWFHFMHLWSDADFTSALTYIRDNLNPAITACLEPSNEVWNFASGFIQSQCYNTLANVRWGYDSDGTKQTYMYYGFRAHAFGSIAATVFASQMNRIIRMFGNHVGDSVATPTGNAYLTYRHQCPSEGYLSGDYPVNYFDQGCVAPYIGPNRDIAQPTDQVWAASYGTTAQQQAAIAYLDARMYDTDDGFGQTVPFLIQKIGWWFQTMANYGLGLTCYEAGANFFPALNVSPFTGPNPYTPPSTGIPVTLGQTEANTYYFNYAQSTQWAATLLYVATAYKAAGGLFWSQYCVVNDPWSAGNMFSLINPTRFGTVYPAYTTFRNQINGR